MGVGGGGFLLGSLPPPPAQKVNIPGKPTPAQKTKRET